MRLRTVWLTILSLTLLFASAVPAVADHGTRPSTRNIRAMGHSDNPASFFNSDIAPMEINSDLAFWGDLAFNGNYDGFRVIDISSPSNPKEIAHQRCSGNQGDILVWEDVLVRSWNSAAPAGATCDGQPVEEGFEGLHVFDISDVTDPQLVASVQTECGSHTATAVPDPDNNRLVVYNNGSGPDCPWFEIVEVPLDAPQDATILRNELLVEATRCHDMAVILGGVNLGVCAAGDAANVYDISNIEDPEFLYTIREEGVGEGGNWHSASFTWDGEVVVLGWEPGGGALGECEATDPDVKKSLFFYDADNGDKLGQWVLPRPQGAEENCTIHNYNIVPLRRGGYVAVIGNYQAGTWVVDFSDPANAQTVAWSDPEEIIPTDLGGAWSSYWYNNFIYESSITEGLNVFRVADRALAGAIRLDHLNPQTQEFSLPLPRGRTRP